MKLTMRFAVFASTATLCLGIAGCGAEQVPTSPQAIQEQAEESAEDVAIGYEAPQRTARADLFDRGGNSIGEVTFAQAENSRMTITAELQGVQPAGLHGIHVHEVGDCSAPDFTSAGGHFNPTGAPHSCPPDPSRHVGDLGNIEIGDDGNGTLELTTDMDMFGDDPTQSIVGRAVILHAGEDDCTSQPSGDSGERIACGLIALVPESSE